MDSTPSASDASTDPPAKIRISLSVVMTVSGGYAISMGVRVHADFDFGQ